jgi:hypothetical protein
MGKSETGFAFEVAMVVGDDEVVRRWVEACYAPATLHSIAPYK